MPPAISRSASRSRRSAAWPRSWAVDLIVVGHNQKHLIRGALVEGIGRRDAVRLRALQPADRAVATAETPRARRRPPGRGRAARRGRRGRTRAHDWHRALENVYSDRWHVLAGVRYTPRHTALVVVDDDTLAALKDDPIAFWAPHFARVLEVLMRAGAKAIGFDFLYLVSAEGWLKKLELPDSAASRSYDAPLRAALAQGRTVLITQLVERSDGRPRAAAAPAGAAAAPAARPARPGRRQPVPRRRQAPAALLPVGGARSGLSRARASACNSRCAWSTPIRRTATGRSRGVRLTRAPERAGSASPGRLARSRAVR